MSGEDLNGGVTVGDGIDGEMGVVGVDASDDMGDVGIEVGGILAEEGDPAGGGGDEIAAGEMCDVADRQRSVNSVSRTASRCAVLMRCDSALQKRTLAVILNHSLVEINNMVVDAVGFPSSDGASSPPISRTMGDSKGAFLASALVLEV